MLPDHQYLQVHPELRSRSHHERREAAPIMLSLPHGPRMQTTVKTRTPIRQTSRSVPLPWRCQEDKMRNIERCMTPEHSRFLSTGIRKVLLSVKGAHQPQLHRPLHLSSLVPAAHLPVEVLRGATLYLLLAQQARQLTATQ